MLDLLHVKSHYSLGVGTASVEALVERAALLGYRTLALTDLETLAAQPRFHGCCRHHGIRPISGLELRPGFPDATAGRRTGRLVLLARNRAGYRSLCRIVSLRRGGAGGGPRADDAVADVLENPEGLMVLSDEARMLERIRAQGGIADEDLGLLVIRPGRGDGPQEAATRNSEIRPVADLDVVMAGPDEHRLHRLLMAVRANRPVAGMRPEHFESSERWLRPRGELERLFSDFPLAVDGAEAVAARCHLTLTPERALLPGAEAFGGADPAGTLTERCLAALAEARAGGRCQGDVYGERLERELTTIVQLGYAGYFLAAAEVAGAAHGADILVAPRGSALGSLVVHLLDISPIDPVATGLMFERFLHSGRSQPPDIDLDVASDRRDDLLGWLRARFGRERVAMVGAHHTFRLRGALREGLRVLGVSTARIAELTSTLPEDGEGADAVPAGTTPAQPFDERRFPAALRAWLPDVLALVGKPRLLALHPAGVLVGGSDLSGMLPLERGPRGLPMSQYDLRAVQHGGFVKLDLLGSKVLAQLGETRDVAHPDRDEPKRSRGAAGVLRPPPDDAATVARLDAADTVGCFQVETPVVRALLEQLPVSGLEDCVTALALVRPGAAAGAAKRDFVRRTHGKEAEEARHPWLDRQLRHTRGLLLYDEDLLTLIADTCSTSLGAADALRTEIIDAGEDEAAMSGLEQRFLTRSRRAGCDDARARAVWGTVRRFAAYSFSRAHAWSYALQAYASVYLKTHAPAAFGCALLNGYGGAYPLRTIGADLERHGVTLLGPSVQDSGLRCRPAPDEAVQVGLGMVRDLAKRTAVRLLDSRGRDGPFRDMDDFLKRVRPARRELRALLLTGACDRLPPLSASGYPWVHEALLDGLAGDLHPRRFEELVERMNQGGGRSAAEDRYRALVRIKHELRYLELHVTAHPMAVLREDARKAGCVTAAAARSVRADGAGAVAGLLAASRRHPLGQGRMMHFLTLEDETGLLEAIIGPERYRRLSPTLTTPGPYLVRGTVNDDHGHRFLAVTGLQPFHERHRVA